MASAPQPPALVHFAGFLSRAARPIALPSHAKGPIARVPVRSAPGDLGLRRTAATPALRGGAGALCPARI